MTVSRVPTNAVDHVGSLKRPPDLMQTWRDWEAGKVGFDVLRQTQDRAIRDAVKMQEKLGLEVVTDGEFRRGGWSRGFLSAVEGFDFRASKLSLSFNRISPASSPKGVSPFHPLCQPASSPKYRWTLTGTYLSERASWQPSSIMEIDCLWRDAICSLIHSNRRAWCRA